MSPKLKNVHLLPSFATPAFESDGVHLTPYSGLEFVLHLFELGRLISPSTKTSPVSSLFSNYLLLIDFHTHHFST